MNELRPVPCDPVPGPDFSHIRPLLLEMARARSSAELLALTALRLAEARNIGFVRVWLCADGTPGSTGAGAGGARGDLVLAASAEDPEAQALRIYDPAAPRPVSAGLDAPGLPSDRSTARWLGDRPEFAWATSRGLWGACSEPLRHGTEFLGAIEVFTYGEVPAEGPEWLRVIADHAAAALAARHAFEELERLRGRLADENRVLRAEISAVRGTSALVGAGPAFTELLGQVELVAPTDASVLILGESGTGKELLAHEVHRQSRRAGRPLVMVNCASIPAELYESEFFGHKRGAFTGADRDRTGRFELANGGSLFLDEIGELPLDMQAKLLRVLQEGTFERVGDSTTRSTDVRILAATNRDLRAEVAAGRFREDLYYRIDVFPIAVPPLRERPEDVPLLVRHFLDALTKRMGRGVPRVSEATLQRLVEAPWPGNVRELRNVLERSLILSRGAELELELAGDRRGAPPRAEPASPRRSSAAVVPDGELQQLAHENLLRALRVAGGKVSGPGGAAELLGLPAATVASRLRRTRGVHPGP